MSERDIFTTAREMTDPVARSAYLDRACGGDAAVKARVEELLLAQDESDSLLDRPEIAPHGTETTVANGIEGGVAADDEMPLGLLLPATRPDSLGRIGHYEVLQVLGQGGFGIVFRAFDDVLHRIVAVKVLSPQLAGTSPARMRFLREARSSAQVRHENVVQVYEVGESPLPYIVMEFIPGETLQQRLDRIGPIEPAEVVRVGRQIAEGLAIAHANGLIHRDIKPGNILLEGGQHKVKLTDFGLARAADDASISQSGIIAGTPMYMAPEQALGHKLDQRADLFSLGSVLYLMAAGRPPFRATGTVAVLKRVAEDVPRDIREIIPETPQWLCGIITKLHAKDPADRFQSAREVADVLADCDALLKATGRVNDSSRIPRRKSAASSAWKWPAAVLLLLILGLAAAELTGVTHLSTGRPRGSALDVSATPIHQATRQSTPEGGWVSLFNGRDLSGWKTHPSDHGSWMVENGSIVGRDGESFLFTDRGDYEDFDLRIEARVDPAGDAGVVFRSKFDVRTKVDGSVEYITGYEAQINVRESWPVHTGSLCRALNEGEPASSAVLSRGPLNTHSPDEWFRMEISARGNHIQLRVNGALTADYIDTAERYQKGNIALQNWAGAPTDIRFRMIEIRELPLPEVPATP